MPANIDSMFYTRRVPWHGLGTRLEEAPDSEAALVASGLMWSVKKEPVFVEGREVPDFFATVRQDNRKVLGIVGERYRVVQNAEAFRWTDALLDNEDGVRYETAGALRKGKQVWMLARMPETFRLAGDESTTYVCFTNSHDGSSSIKVMVTPVRVVCQNTLTYALKTAKRTWSMRHSGDLNAKLHEAKRTLSLVHAYESALAKDAEQLARTQLGSMDQFLARLLPLPTDATSRKRKNTEERRAQIKALADVDDLANHRGTAWAAVNAVADFVAHSEPSRKQERWEEARFEKTVINGHALLDRAHDLVSELAG